MKRTVNVNLGGQSFTIDEDAYEILHHYLLRIEALYARSAGREEILQDIENRVAELLHERLAGLRTVVNKADVDYVMTTMGSPEQFAAADGEADPSSQQRSTEFRSRRFYRDGDDRVLGGVCSGIGHYFGVDPMWIRLGFALGLFFLGTGVFIYLLLWLITPEARTTSEKLHMKGEPVNIGSIGRTIEDEISGLSGGWSTTGTRVGKQARKAEGFLRRTIEFLFTTLQRLITVIAKFIGLLLVVVGVCLLLFWLAGVMGILSFAEFRPEPWVSEVSFFELGRTVFSSDAWMFLAVIALVFLVGAPLLGIIYGGFNLLAPGRRIPFVGGALFGMWFVGLILAIFVGFNAMHQFSKESSVLIELSGEEIQTDTLYIKVGQDRFGSSLNKYDNDWSLSMEEDSLFSNHVAFTIERSLDSHTVVQMWKIARGASKSAAHEVAEKVQYRIATDTGVIVPDAHLSASAPYEFRVQHVKMRLLLPVGRTVYLSPGMECLLNDVRNTTHTWDGDMPGHFWQMRPEGLTCLDCPATEANAPEPGEPHHIPVPDQQRTSEEVRL